MRVHVRVPATSANLGPGFDALGLALALYNEVEAREADGVTVTVQGEGEGQLSSGAENIVARGVRLAFEAAGQPFKGVALRCVNRVPTARGLGSSAAAWVGGLVAGDALLGGVLMPVPDGLAWVVLVPATTASTAEARAVLPRSVPLRDAVFNVQRVALLLAGLQARRPDALVAALEDRLHQPYRRAVFPWMPSVAECARRAGALGCVLSGAGPSLLALVSGDGHAVARAMEAALRVAGVEGRAQTYTVDTSGATVLRVHG